MANLDPWEKELEQPPLGHGGFSVKSITKIKERIQLDGKRKRRPARFAIAAASLALAVVIAWTAIDHRPPVKSTKATLDTEEAHLVVQYMDRNSFMSQIGAPYLFGHPNTTIDVAVPSREYSERPSLASYEQWVAESNADVLQVPLGYIGDLIDAGLIAPLDELIKREKVDLNAMYQPMVRLMKEAGSGTMYGIAGNFDLDLLYYNKSLFDKYGVPVPKEGASWDDIFALASRFQGKEDGGNPIYGLSFGWRFRPYTAIDRIGEMQGLSIFDAQGRPQLDSKAWSKLWKQFAGGLAEGWIDGEPGVDPNAASWTMDDIIGNDAFYNDRSAMTIQPFSAWFAMSDAIAKGRLKGEWDAIPLGADPSAPGKQSVLRNATIYAVNAKSGNKEQAMKLIAYIVGQQKSNLDAETAGLMQLNAVPPNNVDNGASLMDKYYGTDLDVASVIWHEERRQLPGFASVRELLRRDGERTVKDIASGLVSVEDALSRLQGEALRVIAEAKP